MIAEPLEEIEPVARLQRLLIETFVNLEPPRVEIEHICPFAEQAVRRERQAVPQLSALDFAVLNQPQDICAGVAVELRMIGLINKRSLWTFGKSFLDAPYGIIVVDPFVVNKLELREVFLKIFLAESMRLKIKNIQPGAFRISVPLPVLRQPVFTVHGCAD